MMIASILLMTFFLSVIDNQSKTDMYNRVDAATKHESARLKDLSYEYANWNLAYQKTIVENDVEWIHKTYRDYLAHYYQFDLIILIKADKSVEVLGGTDPNVENYARGILQSPSIQLKIKLAHEKSNKYIGSIFTTKINSVPFVMSADPFTDEETNAVFDGSILIFARQLDDDLVQKLSKDYDLPKIYVDNTSQSFDGFLYIHNLMGEPISRISWNIARTVTSYVPYLAIFLVGLLCIALLIVRTVLRRDLKNRSSYEDELYSAATTDPLTNAYNKRYLTSYARHQLKLYEKRNKDLSLLTLDLDHFKSINDKYGHHTGDNALVHFCDICNKNLRDIDVFSRIGGEEFAIILPGAKLEDATIIAERIRTDLNKTPLDVGPELVTITVSIGVTTRRNGISFEDLLREADEAMYQAKESGRNKVVSYKI